MKTIYIGFNEEVINLGPLNLCLGFFDGIHLGHKALIDCALKDGRKVGLITFDKSPIDIIKNTHSGSLTSIKDREEILSSLGVDYLICLKNDINLLNMSASEFVERIIIPLGSKKVISGFDNHFGRGREGNADFLKEKYSSKFEIEIVDEVSYHNVKISSTYIRSLVKEGKIKFANYLLSRPYTLRGIVVKGNQIGRTISFPTINLKLDCEYILPPNGVYASQVVIDGRKYIGVTNIGVHPSINQLNEILVESHLINFNEDIYGREVKVQLYDFVRSEQKFSSLEELKKQIQSDKNYVINYFDSLIARK